MKLHIIKGKARNNIGEFISLKQRLLYVALPILLITATTGILTTFNSPQPPLINPLSPVQKAYAKTVTNNDTITDPLYLLIKNDPMKKYIYLTFGQINTDVARQALEIAKQESGFNPNSRNKQGSSAKGLFQIIDGTWKGYTCSGSVFNYVDNTNCAVRIYKSNHSWSQWATKPIYIN